MPHGPDTVGVVHMPNKSIWIEVQRHPDENELRLVKQANGGTIVLMTVPIQCVSELIAVLNLAVVLGPPKDDDVSDS